MKKITAFVGSFRKKNTYQVVEQYLRNLQALGEIEYDIVRLSEYHLEICRGCQACTNKGEAFCPLKDDRDVLLAKIDASDGVIFAAPNYTWGVSGLMKVFMDRFGFIVHRPRFFGKAFTSIVTQAMGQGDKIVDYFDYAAHSFGFNTIKGIVTTGFDPKTEKQLKKIDHDLVAHSQRFYTLLNRPPFPEPTLFQLMYFRIGRSMIKHIDTKYADHGYYAEKGWFESDYFYPTTLNAIKKTAGSLFDRMAPTIQKMMA